MDRRPKVTGDTDLETLVDLFGPVVVTRTARGHALTGVPRPRPQPPAWAKANAERHQTMLDRAGKALALHEGPDGLSAAQVGRRMAREEGRRYPPGHARAGEFHDYPKRTVQKWWNLARKG